MKVPGWDLPNAPYCRIGQSQPSSISVGLLPSLWLEAGLACARLLQVLLLWEKVSANQEPIAVSMFVLSRHSVGRCGAVEVFLVGRRRYLLLKTRCGRHNCGDRKHCWGYFCVGERKCFICREPIARVVRDLAGVRRSRLCLVRLETAVVSCPHRRGNEVSMSLLEVPDHHVEVVAGSVQMDPRDQDVGWSASRFVSGD